MEEFKSAPPEDEKYKDDVDEYERKKKLAETQSTSIVQTSIENKYENIGDIEENKDEENKDEENKDEENKDDNEENKEEMLGYIDDEDDEERYQELLSEEREAKDQNEKDNWGFYQELDESPTPLDMSEFDTPEYNSLRRRCKARHERESQEKIRKNKVSELKYYWDGDTGKRQRYYQGESNYNDLVYNFPYFIQNRYPELYDTCKRLGW